MIINYIKLTIKLILILSSTLQIVESSTHDLLHAEDHLHSGHISEIIYVYSEIKEQNHVHHAKAESFIQQSNCLHNFSNIPLNIAAKLNIQLDPKDTRAIWRKVIGPVKNHIFEVFRPPIA